MATLSIALNLKHVAFFQHRLCSQYRPLMLNSDLLVRSDLFVLMIHIYDINRPVSDMGMSAAMH